MLTRTRAAAARRAAAATELAVLLPFLAFLFLVVVDFCRVFHTTQTVQGCAETGALYAGGTAQRPPGTSAEEAARQAAVADGAVLDPPLRAEDVSVAVTEGSATVTVTYQFQTISRYPGLPRTLTLVRTVTAPVTPRVGQSR